MSFKKIIGLALIIICNCLSSSALAADGSAKEDITPPPADGLLTVDQIPAISSLMSPSPLNK